jgi:hypothetical protein
MTNAFDWMKYTEEEHAKNGDPFKQIKQKHFDERPKVTG